MTAALSAGGLSVQWQPDQGHSAAESPAAPRPAVATANGSARWTRRVTGARRGPGISGDA
jgi:hypothetical protein